MHPEETVERALDLYRAGLNDCEVSRILNVPRGTIRDWRNGRRPVYDKAGNACLASKKAWSVPNVPLCAADLRVSARPLPRRQHDFGAPPRRLWAADFLDRRYIIVEEARAAIALINPSGKANVQRHAHHSMNIVNGWSKHWTHLFPQHGPGAKHLRPIRLEPWQQRIAEAHPGRLVRGLIHSDGCRVQNVVRHPQKSYSYPRYFFSNKSADIQGIFTDACDLLGVRWR